MNQPFYRYWRRPPTQNSLLVTKQYGTFLDPLDPPNHTIVSSRGTFFAYVYGVILINLAFMPFLAYLDYFYYVLLF